MVMAVMHKGNVVDVCEGVTTEFHILSFIERSHE